MDLRPSQAPSVPRHLTLPAHGLTSPRNHFVHHLNCTFTDSTRPNFTRNLIPGAAYQGPEAHIGQPGICLGVAPPPSRVILSHRRCRFEQEKTVVQRAM
jgi:hypothetical protein